MIVAVTGANGFIGRHLVDAFRRSGHEVRPAVRDDVRHGRLPALFENADAVVHAAAATRAPTRDDLWCSNVELTREVCAAATAAGARRLVFLSSQAAAGPAWYRDKPVREDDPAAPIEEYGRTKLAAEQIVRAAPIASAVLRLSAVYGPGDRDFRALFRAASRGVAVHPGNREQWFSIVHVRDVVDAVARATTREEAVGRTYFIANREPVRWGDFFARVAGEAGTSLHVDLQIPAPVARVGAMFGDVVARLTGQTPLLSSEKLALARPAFWLCATDRAEAELGFRASVGLEEGVRETLRWYEANGW